jgi:hypothetical protein
MSWLSLLLAGFQVATYGRFWVATEDDHRRHQLGDNLPPAQTRQQKVDRQNKDSRTTGSPCSGAAGDKSGS